MRAIALLTTLPLALLAACGTGDEAAPTVSDDLRADLQLASSASVELAAEVGHDSAVVSAIERIPARSPDRAAAPRRNSTPRAPVPRPTPEPTPEPAPAPAPTAADEGAEVVAEAPVQSDLPVATRPVPVSYPTGGGTASGGTSGDDGIGAGEVIGTVIGVVIRGGGTGDDHCEIHPRGRRGRGGVIATGIPSIPGRTGGLPRPTYPGTMRMPRY